MIENTLTKLFLKPKVVCFVQNKLLRSIARRVTRLENNDNVSVAKPDTRILKVAVIGMPNAGKSTFINSLMDKRVCAVSSRAHTTRTKATAVFTHEDSQIVFVDTPGLVNDRETKRFQLEKGFKRDCRKSLQQADIIGVIHDVSHPYKKETLDIKVVNLLESHKDTPSFLVLNKIDVLKSKRKLLDLTKILTENHIDGKPIPGNFKQSEMKGWKYFKDVFMVSALTGDGINDIKNFLFRNARPGEWMFPEDIWTDQTPETIVLNTVKAVLLNFLPQEIPYSMKPEIEYLNTNSEGEINTVVLVRCPNARIANLVAGDSDGRLRQIISTTQRDLQEAFHSHVKLTIVLYPREEK